MIKLLLILLCGLAMARAEYPLPENIGGQWLKTGGYSPPSGPLWRRAIRATNLYFVSQPIQQLDEVRHTGWKGYHNSHYGLGLQWKITF